MVSGRWNAFAVVLIGMLGACGSDDSGNGDDPGGAGSGSAGNTEVGTELDASMFFSPMYSAYDGEHPYKVPAIVNGYTGVEWEAENPDLVDLVKTGENRVEITTRAPGETRIIARSGPLSGSAMLYITEASPQDWQLGYDRYHNEIALPNFDPMMAMGMGFTIPDDLSCRNCHGGGAEALAVEHTPQQTGGFSDEQLVSIFSMGMKPPGSDWNSPIPEQFYSRFHTWTATPEEQKGLVVYLRSLEPKAQNEDIDFGGLFNRDGSAGSGTAGTGGGAGM